MSLRVEAWRFLHGRWPRPERNLLGRKANAEVCATMTSALRLNQA